MKEDTIYQFTITLSKKTSLTFIIVFAAIVVFDSTIVDFSSYSGVRIPTALNLAIFITFSIIFGLSSILLLYYVRKSTAADTQKGLSYFQITIGATLALTIAIILIIIFEILVVNKYSLILLRIQIYLSHLSALTFLSFFLCWMAVKIKKKLCNHAIRHIILSSLH